MGEGAISRLGGRRKRKPRGDQRREEDDSAKRLHGRLEGGRRAGTRPNGGGGREGEGG